MFVIEKHIEDVEQDQKNVLDLRICPKWINLDPKSKNIGLVVFRCPEKSRISAGGCLQEQSSSFLAHF